MYLPIHRLFLSVLADHRTQLGAECFVGAVFEEAALEAIAQKAIDRKIGARGLRAVLESVMTRIMYEIPSDPSITKVLITRECVENGVEPDVVRSKDNRGNNAG